MKETPIAWLTRNEYGDPSMLFFDQQEASLYCEIYEYPEALFTASQVFDIPLNEISQMLNELIKTAVDNGANSISMPDNLVIVAKWLMDIEMLKSQIDKLKI